MKKSNNSRGIQYEKTQCTKLGGKHVGGPGKPDCIVNGNVYEIKNWKIPAHAGVIRKAKKSGCNAVLSKSGFTDNAVKEAKKLNIKLLTGK